MEGEMKIDKKGRKSKKKESKGRGRKGRERNVTGMKD